MATARAPKFIHFKNHGFLQIQEVSSPSSDSSSDSSPGATYVPPSDWEWQRNYSDREVESHVSADTYRPRFVPARNHGFLQNQELSSPSSDSSSDSSPGATYVPPSGWEWQSNYSGREVESHVNADTYRPRFVPARNHRFLQTQEVSSPSSDSSSNSSPGSTYVPPSGWEWQMNYSGQEVESHVNADTYTPSLDLERLSIYSDTDIESHTDTYAAPSDLGLQWDYSDNENEVYANVAEGKWITHYNSNHRILLVGEGDFSFSACLAVAFGSAPNIIATSLDSEYFLMTNYEHAMSNIEKLTSRECLVLHGVDATEVATHRLLRGMTFDRIIFNFPFAGFFKYLPREDQLRKHRRLVRLFLKNAKKMIGENGEIHISHKINGFHIEWNLESLASFHGLGLIEAVEFNQSDYEGYNTKCGFGGNNNFNCDPSQTYKFGVLKGNEFSGWS